MVAGGGASVVLYADPIVTTGYARALGNYGEYSGAPSEGQTYEYVKAVFDLITRPVPCPNGKTLIIGGGIANFKFTNVAATFTGIIQAVEGAKAGLIAHGVGVPTSDNAFGTVKIDVRRGGPNWQEGLKVMRLLGEASPVRVHLTSLYPPNCTRFSKPVSAVVPSAAQPAPTPSEAGTMHPPGNAHSLTTFSFDLTILPPRTATLPQGHETQSFLYSLQPQAIQGMLDFGYPTKLISRTIGVVAYIARVRHNDQYDKMKGESSQGYLVWWLVEKVFS